MFQFPGFASHTYGFSARYRKCGGLPHSDIFGSKFARNSPKLFAACHVLHRLSAPRHPPNALKTLDRRHFACRDKLPHTNGLLLAVKSSAHPPDDLLGPPANRVPHPLHPVKQQSAFLRTRLFGFRVAANPKPPGDAMLASLAAFSTRIVQMVEPTGIEPVTSSLQS